MQVNPRENILAPNSSSTKFPRDAAIKKTTSQSSSKTTVRSARPKKMSLQEQVLAAAQAESVFTIAESSSKAVDISNIVRKPKTEDATHVEIEKSAGASGKITEID